MHRHECRCDDDVTEKRGERTFELSHFELQKQVDLYRTTLAGVLS